jgi:uncharacterized membrane protein
MSKEEVFYEFEKSRKYRNIGFFIILLSIIPAAFLNGVFRYIFTLIVFGIGVYFERQYKCPFCGYVFDPRIKYEEIKYCLNCNNQLHE